MGLLGLCAGTGCFYGAHQLCQLSEGLGWVKVSEEGLDTVGINHRLDTMVWKVFSNLSDPVWLREDLVLRCWAVQQGSCSVCGEWWV